MHRKCGCVSLARIARRQVSLPLDGLLAVYLHETAPTIAGVVTNEAGGPPAQLIGSYCGDFDGIITVAVPDLIGTESVISNGGTSSVSVTAGTLHFTVGTCWNLILSSGHIFSFAEGYANEAFNMGTGSDGTLSSVPVGFWDTQDEHHRNIIEGFDKYSDGTDEINVPIGKIPSDIAMVLQSTRPAGIYHNGAECGIDIPNTFPSVIGGDCPDPLQYYDFEGNFNSVDTAFSNVKEFEHRYLIFYDHVITLEEHLLVQIVLQQHENMNVYCDINGGVYCDENGIYLEGK